MIEKTLQIFVSGLYSLDLHKNTSKTMNQNQRNDIALKSDSELEADINRYGRKVESCNLKAIRRSLEKRLQALIDEKQIRMIAEAI